jgi:hypothetical protein
MVLSKALFLYFILFGEASAVDNFPESDDPITELPSLQRPSTPSHTVRVFDEAACTSWNEILTSNYEPPAGGAWNRVIFDMMVSKTIFWMPLSHETSV